MDIYNLIEEVKAGDVDIGPAAVTSVGESWCFACSAASAWQHQNLRAQLSPLHKQVLEGWRPRLLQAAKDLTGLINTSHCSGFNAKITSFDLLHQIVNVHAVM